MQIHEVIDLDGNLICFLNVSVTVKTLSNVFEQSYVQKFLELLEQCGYESNSGLMSESI